MFFGILSAGASPAHAGVLSRPAGAGQMRATPVRRPAFGGVAVGACPECAGTARAHGVLVGRAVTCIAPLVHVCCYGCMRVPVLYVCMCVVMAHVCACVICVYACCVKCSFRLVGSVLLSLTLQASPPCVKFIKGACVGSVGDKGGCHHLGVWGE